MTDAVSEELTSLSSTMQSIEAVLDLDGMRAAIAVLAEQAAAPSFWDDPEAAQKITGRLSRLRAEVRRTECLRGRIDDLAVLFELAQEADDPDTRAEAEAELVAVREALGEMEVCSVLAGEYDQREALVNIRAGTGGIGAADFAEWLQRMYLRWAERHGHGTEVYETSHAEMGGIKSTTFVVRAPYAYGMLSAEQGTHRLVRSSPFDSRRRGPTSTADIVVLPVAEKSDHVAIYESDLRVDVYRSPGGGCRVTPDSVVRITHIPTGIVITCENERSPARNKANAMEVLQTKLLQQRRQEEPAKTDVLHGNGGSSGTDDDFIRSYVLFPRQTVEDVRTGHEADSVAAVLDGGIDGFLEAGVRWRRNNAAGRLSPAPGNSGRRAVDTS